MARKLFQYAAFFRHDEEKQETQICALVRQQHFGTSKISSAWKLKRARGYTVES